MNETALHPRGDIGHPSQTAASGYPVASIASLDREATLNEIRSAVRRHPADLLAGAALIGLLFGSAIRRR